MVVPLWRGSAVVVLEGASVSAFAQVTRRRWPLKTSDSSAQLLSLHVASQTLLSTNLATMLLVIIIGSSLELAVALDNGFVLPVRRGCVLPSHNWL